MKKIKILVAGILMVPALTLGLQAAGNVSVQAQQGGVRDGLGVAEGSGVPKELDGQDGLVKKAINIMLYVIGIIAVIMLIFGGIRYATSAGDSNKVTSAKNTIIYAIVGLIVAIFAYAIVNWVLTGVGV